MENLYRSVPAAKLPWTVTVHTVVPAMDQANPDLKRLQSLFEDEAAILGSGADLSVIRLSDYICREQADSEQKGVPWTVSSFGDLPNPIITDNLYFPTEADTLEFLYGYFKNIAMGSVVAPQVFEKAVENKDGSPNGLARIIDYVAHCSGGQVIHVVICGPSGWGGEGRTHTNILPAFLFRKCVQKLAGADRMTVTNRHMFTSTAAFRCVAALERDGKTLRRITLDTDVPPLSEKTYALPFGGQELPGEYAVTVSFLLREDTPWAKAGYEIAFGQGTWTVAGGRKCRQRMRRSYQRASRRPYGTRSTTLNETAHTE